MERLIHRPDDVVSCPDALINKAKIAIQISPSGRQSALVWMRAHQLRKLPTSTVRTSASHGPDARIADMEIACWSSAVQTFIPLGPDVRKPYMEVTCSGHTTVRTSVSHRPDTDPKQERFSAKFSENPIAQLSVQTASVHITAVAHSAPQPINRGPWALRTAREVQDPSKAVTSVLLYIWSLS
jgi:hypothetical protein